MTLRLRPDIASLPAYVPGKSRPGSVKLASNETTLGPLPSVAEAIADAARGLNRYPDNGQIALTELLAGRLGVGADQVQVGNGSVTLCQNLVTVTCTPGDEVLFAQRSFEAYPIVALAGGAKPVTVPLTSWAVHDLRAMAGAVTERTRLIFVCNPNNPTGTVVTRDALEDFLEAVPSDVVVALDEAYIEYVRPSDAERIDGVDLVRRHPNVVVLRTFSKAYGLAGLRVGYAIGSPEIIGALRRVHVPFSVNSLAQAAAVACLAPDAEPELLARTDRIVTERIRVTTALRDLGYTVPVTQTNFYWLDLGDGAAQFAADAAEAGFIVRPFAGSGVRITVTDPAENDPVVAFASNWPS